MQAKMDHVVLWVSDPLRFLDVFEKVVGLLPVRADEFRAGKAPFPSVRVSSDSIIYFRDPDNVIEARYDE